MKRAILQLLFLLFTATSIAQTPKIVKMVFWYNDNYQQKTTMHLTANVNDELIATLPFKEGTRKIGDTISFQFYDNQGNWSPIYSQYMTDSTKESFYKTPVSLEYWYGDNFAKRKTKKVAVLNSTDTLNINIPWQVGEDKLFYRFLSKFEQMSPIINRGVDLATELPAKKIVKLVYWYNDDYKKRKSLPLNVSKNEVANAVLSFTEQEREIGDVISFQFLNEKGDWSPIYSQITQDPNVDSFYKAPVTLEYWAKDNYATKKTKVINVANASDTLSINLPWKHQDGNIAYRFLSKFKQSSPIIYSKTNLKILSPNGGETYTYGKDSIPIKWEATGAIKNISIELVEGQLTTKFKVIADPIRENNGKFTWAIPYDVPAGKYRIKMYELGSGKYEDYSDATFIIKKPQITCVSSIVNPEVLAQGNKAQIKYTVKNTGDADYTGNLKLIFETRTGKHELASFTKGLKVNEAHTLTFNANEIISPVGTWELRVEGDNNLVFCRKDIKVIPDNSTVTLLKPNGGETFKPKEKVSIKWSSTGNIKNISIDLLKGKSDTKHLSIANAVPNNGSFLWTIPDTIKQGNYRIKIYKAGKPSLSDFSDSVFGIKDSKITCLNYRFTPEVLVQDNKAEIEYTVKNIGKSDYSGTLRLIAELGNQKRELTTLSTGLSSGKSYTLSFNTEKVDFPIGTWELRVEGDNNLVFCRKDIKVIPDNSTVTLLKPNGGETFKPEEKVSIKWTSTGNTKSISIDLLRGKSDIKHLSIAKAVPNNGSFLWTIPDTIKQGDYRIKIYKAGKPSLSDFSDSVFGIKDSKITCLNYRFTPEVLVQDNKAEIEYTVKNIGKSDYSGTLRLIAELGNQKRELTTLSTGLSSGKSYTLSFNTEKVDFPIGTWELRVEGDNNLVFCRKDIKVIPDNSTVTLLKPNGGETFKPEEKVSIKWTSTGNIKSISIDLLRGKSDIKHLSIAKAVPNNGSFLWTIPDTIKQGNYRVKIYKAGKPSLSDFSDSVFGILRVPLSIKNNKLLECNLYPNPTKAIINLSSKLIKITKVIVYDMNSKKLLQKDTDSKVTSIDISKLPSGLYVFKIELENNKIISHQIIKK